MRFRFRRVIPALFAVALAASLSFQTYPPPDSDFTVRVANRKQISHILYETRGGKNTLTLLMTHPRHWSFHASSHPLYHSCGTYAQCLSLLKKLNRFLGRGWNLRLKLDGSMIREIEFLEP